MNTKIVLKAEREKSLLRRHPWIFEGAIDYVKGSPKPGDTIDVYSSKKKWLAKAAYSPDSQIRARVWTFDKSESVDNVFFKKRINLAFKRRQDLIKQHKTNAYRLIAAESDGLPGITIDVYDTVVVMQLLSCGADKQRDKIVSAINQLFKNVVIHERSDVDVRKKEGLEPLVQTLQGNLPDTVKIKENDVSILVDLINGHKTGFYLDQRQNRLTTANLCKGKRVLNCFSYTGTFGLYALQNGAKEVVNIDASENALALSQENVAINNLPSKAVKHLKADVFEQLRNYKYAKEKFDVIVLDPPKFVDSKKSLPKAARAYKDINRLALELLNEGGYLLTYSCSGLMPADLFQKIVADGALDAGVSAQFIKHLGQDEDHPISTAFPEGYYLKGLVCRI